MAVNLTDAQIRSLFPTYFTPAALADGPNKTQLDVNKIRQILNIYSNKEGGRNYIGNKLGVDQSVVGRIITKAIKEKIIERVKPGEFTATSQRKYTLENPRNIYKTVRPVEPRDYIKNPDIPKSAKFKAQVPGGSIDRSTTMVYGSTKEIVKNKIEKADKLTEIRKNLKEKPFKDAIKSIHKIAMADPEDLNDIKKLSNMVYGADDVKNLTRTANDLVRYQEFLLGFRPIAGITVPVGEKLDDIISEFPSSGQWGKFAAGTIRESKLKIRDQLLKTKGPKLAKLRRDILRFVDSGAMELDEAMGVSATYERAPGYTELGQVIKKGINQAKRAEIDNPFSRLFEKVVRGDTGLEKEIKDFNKISREFQKINKVDTPIIEYTPGKKIDASKFIKHFDKLSPEAQVNVKELAGRGIALRSEALPMRSILLKAAETNEGGVCQIFRAEGGRIGFAAGSNCARQMEMAFDTDPVRTTEQINKIKTVPEKVKSAGMGFLNFVKRGGKFGALAAAGAAGAGLVKTFMNDDPTTYLSNEDQQKNMLISMITDPVVDEPKSDAAILDYQLPVIGAGAVAGTAAVAPSTIEAARSGALGAKKSGITKTGLKTLGRGLAALGTPAALLATEPLFIGGQIAQGDSLGEIATDPINYLGAAFADPATRFATKGLGPTASKIMRLGISPGALRIASRAFGLPGLALSLGISGYEMYDDYKKKRGMFSEE
jgi:hypothetical protein